MKIHHLSLFAVLATPATHAAPSSSKAAKPKSAKKAKTQAPAGGPNPSPGPPVPAPPTPGTSSPTKLCLSGITCTDTLTCVSSGYSECNPSGCCVNAENPPGPPVSFSPVTSPPTSELSLFTALGAGLCNDNQGRLYPLIVGNLGSFQGSASDAENCAQWCNQHTTNLVGMDYFSNAGVLECHCLFSGSVPSPTPIYKDPPSSGMRPNSGAGAVAKATSNPSAPTAQCYALLSAGTASPITTLSPTTNAPVSHAPVSQHPVTTAPTSHSPVSTSPTTTAPVTVRPTTHSPVVPVPAGTQAPTTHSPVTTSPTSHAPVTVSPTTHSPVTTSPTSQSFLKVPGRCSWTEPDCEALQTLVDTTLNHPDVALLQTEICQAFATLSPPIYPPELHCPSEGHQPVTGHIKRINGDQEELNAATGWSTCGGAVTIKKGILQDPFYEYNVHGYVTKEVFGVPIYEAFTTCPQMCADDPLCKFAFWDRSYNNKDLGIGICTIFHESDTFSQDGYWRKSCGWSHESCVEGPHTYLFAKCDNFNVNPTGTSSPIAASTPSPTITQADNPLDKIPGRCAWTEPDCQDLGKAINVLNQHQDLSDIHTGLCKAFAAMGHYPLSLHCPSTDYTAVKGKVLRIDEDNGELTAATNYSTCGGGIKLARGKLNFVEWMIHGVLANTIPMFLVTAREDCPKACEDDPLCKYAMWVQGYFNINEGKCMTFHESDTLTPGTYWTKPCTPFSEDACRDQFAPFVYAKCDNFNNPSYNSDFPTKSPTSPPSKTLGTTNPPTNDIFTPVQGPCAWTQPECLYLQQVINRATQHSDVTHLHTELCQVFANLGQYPDSLHCPSAGHQNVTGTLKRVSGLYDGELTAASNYSTCGGGLKIEKNVLFEWKINAKVANTIPMNIDDADTLCFNQCQNDPFCKYSGWFQRTGTIIAGSGDCLIFHESDTLTNGKAWTRVCGWSAENCLDTGTGLRIFAKCDNFNSP